MGKLGKKIFLHARSLGLETGNSSKKKKSKQLFTRKKQQQKQLKETLQNGNLPGPKRWTKKKKKSILIKRHNNQ